MATSYCNGFTIVAFIALGATIGIFITEHKNQNKEPPLEPAKYIMETYILPDGTECLIFKNKGSIYNLGVSCDYIPYWRKP